MKKDNRFILKDGKLIKRKDTLYCTGLLKPKYMLDLAPFKRTPSIVRS